MDNNGILLKSLEINGDTVIFDFDVSSHLSKFFTTHKMFVKYDRSVEDVPKSILVIPFVGSLIALTWLTDSVMWVKEIDDTFYRALKEIKLAYQELYPHYRLGGRFVSAYRKRNQIMCNDANSSVLLFSGGIDAHTSYINNMSKDLLLCNIQGWLDDPQASSKAQEEDFRNITNFGECQNVPIGLIKSNFAKIVDVKAFRKIEKKLHGNWWYKFQHSMAFISISIPLAYMSGRGEIIIASSYYLGSDGICASYPTTDTEFKFATSGYTIHDGFEYTRQQKLTRLVNYQQGTGQPYPISVCSFNDHNCGVCPKCFRTIMGIIAEGGDISKFGFERRGNLKEFYSAYIKNNYIKFGVNDEAALFWPDIKKRISENYAEIEEKEFVDWFCKTDFVTDRKRAVFKYRVNKFLPLIIKRIQHLFNTRNYI